ncbi:DUF2235 domain-containing protein [uncultured Lamprocystis sp.]|jgi:hypothetical protein|uniref:T6SS phospholipase effector Tle1-like catalytic domain-containing protein n=1 Tax=uncultured Lamprocystis sp. TaxID=543132 RepID=UPI0025FEC439|nr:DUF2235 domain-containing protein [uncultured Lamprocystis sp.]
MSKNIVLLSDGTGQSGGVGYETNIWRLYQALVHDNPWQVCCYDDGVGSQDLKLLRAVGGAFGWGLNRNVRDLYGFLVRQWEPGDHIYLFGFSRGAFTVRLLTGLITQCGILDLNQIDSEAHLDRLLRAACCAARRGKSAPQIPVHFRQAFARQEPTPVHFVGVWDTVDALGVPFDELREAIDKVIRYSFRDRILSAQVAHGCQALSLDDARKTFHPVLWDERIEDQPGRIEQVWFAGVHANVGGGYPKPQLALISLDWMIERVTAFDQSPAANGAPGLLLHPAALDQIRRTANAHGRLNDSRSGLGAIYRFAPRDTEAIRAGYTEAELVIHPSVQQRIALATDQYAPHNLTEHSSLIKTLAPTHQKLADWGRAMAQCGSIVWLRRLVYFAVLCSVVLLLLRESWAWLGGAGPHITPSAGWVPAWLDRLLSQPWTRWGPLTLVPLLIVLRQQLKSRQNQLANAGWAILSPHHRPHSSGAAPQHRLLALAERISTASGARLIAFLSSTTLVRLLALIFFLPLWLGRQIHSAWCFRGLKPGQQELQTPLFLNIGDVHRLAFMTRDFSCPTGLRVQVGERYRILVERWSGWADDTLRACPNGLCDPPPLLLKLAKPLFRRPDQPVLALLAGVSGRGLMKIGRGADITPTVTGNLEFFVNDADLRIPLLRDIFYCNNRGVARIRIERLPNTA